MPTNYDALLAEVEESETFSFTIKGETFELRRSGTLTRDQIRELSVADIYDTIRLLLVDPDSWERFEALDLPAMVIKDPLDAQYPERGILADYQTWAGVRPGELRASRRSSQSTSRRSKPTSPAGTTSRSRKS